LSASGGLALGAGLPPAEAVLPGGYRLTDDDRALLGVLAEYYRAGRSAGRAVLVQRVVALGTIMGAGTVRSGLERLAALGLASCARGRRGSSLTPAGARLLGIGV
jgi:hypothetical protein